MLGFDIGELKKVYDDLYRLSEIKFDLWDENRQLLFSYPEEHCPFCGCVRSCPGLSEKCEESDAAAFAEADRTGRVCIYRCHMGLTEAVAPIVRNGCTIGYMMFGQAMEYDGLADISRLTEEAALKYGADGEAMKRMIAEAPKTERCRLEACARIMEMITTCLWQKNIVSVRHNAMFQRLAGYISRHLNEELDVRGLCAYLNISQTALYTLSVENCGTGINAFIRKKRTEAARELLTSTDLGIREIAERVGIPDPNYFVKVFREETGETPSGYRKNNK